MGKQQIVNCITVVWNPQFTALESITIAITPTNQRHLKIPQNDNTQFCNNIVIYGQLLVILDNIFF